MKSPIHDHMHQIIQKSKAVTDLHDYIRMELKARNLVGNWKINVDLTLEDDKSEKIDKNQMLSAAIKEKLAAAVESKKVTSVESMLP